MFRADVEFLFFKFIRMEGKYFIRISVDGARDLEMHGQTDAEITGYRSVIQDAIHSKKGGHNSGGIVLLYNNALRDWFSIVKKSPDFLGFKISKDYNKTNKDMDFTFLTRSVLMMNYSKNINLKWTLHFPLMDRCYLQYLWATLIREQGNIRDSYLSREKW